MKQAVKKYNYQFDNSKFMVVGVGANIAEPDDKDDSAGLPFHPQATDFLWIGVDWQRKQGDFSVSVRQKVFGAQLQVVGPVAYAGKQPWVVQHGKLDYSKTADFETLKRLYRQCSGLPLPSTADLTPCAIAEAFAFGRPVFASTVGGILEMLQDPSCGFSISEDNPEHWVDSILAFFAKYNNSHTAVSAACRTAFQQHHNWDTIANRVVDTIKSDVFGGRPSLLKAQSR